MIVHSIRAMKWETKYPAVADCIEPIANVVKLLRNCPEDGELEARFGTIHDKRFASGVPRSEIERILDMFQQSRFVQGDTEWIEEQDFFFEVDGTSYRTRVVYNVEDMVVVPTTIIKTNVMYENIRLAEPIPGFDVRIALKREQPVSKRIDQCVSTTCVRIKQRRRFTTICGNWAFDFGMVWSGTTKTEAETKQSSVDPIFEIECELVNKKQILATRDDRTIATSILLKMHDLVDQKNAVFLHNTKLYAQ